MSQTVTCSVHGQRAAAFACGHVLSSLNDQIPRGLFFDRDENGCFNGWCSHCEAVVKANQYSWTPEIMSQADVKLLCEDCFRLAMKINNVFEGH